MQYSGRDNRKFVRANFPCKIVIFPPSDYCITTHTENISAGGMKVIIEEKLPVNLDVGIEISLKEKIIKCNGRIVWVVTRGSPYRKGIFYYDTGFAFTDLTDEDKVIIDAIVSTIVSRES